MTTSADGVAPSAAPKIKQHAATMSHVAAVALQKNALVRPSPREEGLGGWTDEVRATREATRHILRAVWNDDFSDMWGVEAGSGLVSRTDGTGRSIRFGKWVKTVLMPRVLSGARYAGYLLGAAPKAIEDCIITFMGEAAREESSVEAEEGVTCEVVRGKAADAVLRECDDTGRCLSCMTEPNAPYLRNWLIGNPDVMGLLVVREKGLLKSRRLIWTLLPCEHAPAGAYYLDNQYGSSACGRGAERAWLVSQTLPVLRGECPAWARVIVEAHGGAPYLDTLYYAYAGAESRTTGRYLLAPWALGHHPGDKAWSSESVSHLRGVDGYHLSTPFDGAYEPEEMGCCDSCGGSFREDDLYFLDGVGASVCPYCRENHYTYISHGSAAGEYVHQDGAVYCEDIHGSVYCDDAVEATAGHYSGEYIYAENAIHSGTGHHIWHEDDDIHEASVLRRSGDGFVEDTEPVEFKPQFARQEGERVYVPLNMDEDFVVITEENAEALYNALRFSGHDEDDTAGGFLVRRKDLRVEGGGYAAYDPAQTEMAL